MEESETFLRSHEGFSDQEKIYSVKERKVISQRSQVKWWNFDRKEAKSKTIFIDELLWD